MPMSSPQMTTIFGLPDDCAIEVSFRWSGGCPECLRDLLLRGSMRAHICHGRCPFFAKVKSRYSRRGRDVEAARNARGGAPGPQGGDKGEDQSDEHSPPPGGP